MVSRVTKGPQPSQSLPWKFLRCKCGSCHFNTQKAALTHPPWKKKEKKTTHDEVETRKQISLIPLSMTHVWAKRPVDVSVMFL